MRGYGKYRYELIAALSGATVMILELVGARMMAPYFGTSLYVWTAIIGVILGALSVGYWYGGRLADRSANDRGLMVILGLAAFLVAVSLVLQASSLQFVAALGLDVRLSALFSALLLFAPASMLLGIVSPYVAKLKLSSLATAGSSIGQLYAAGTVGSIAGTFLAGYWLIAWFGNFMLGVGVVVALIVISFIAERQTFVWARIGGGALGVALLLLLSGRTDPGIVADIDSPYARYQVSEQVVSGMTRRYLLMDSVGAQSGVIVGQPGRLIFGYTQGFKALSDAYGTAERVLVVGGGAYTFPSFLAAERPDTRVDVVEIDAALDAVAEQYFGYHPRPNLHLIHEDGRVFLNRSTEQYQLLYIDAFSSLTPPYQLATREATQQMQRALAPGGIMAANVIAAPTDSDPYFMAMLGTYRAVFRSVKIYRVQPHIAESQRQNLLFVMGDTGALAGLPELGYPTAIAPYSDQVLTDDHAPVEQLIQRTER